MAARDPLAEWYQALPAAHAAVLAQVAETIECCAGADADVPDREDAPADEELWGLTPDPASDPPSGLDARLLELPADLRDAYLDMIQCRGVPEPLPAGRLPRGLGDGAGFGAGAAADRLPPGVVLAGLASDVWAGGLATIGDDELIGVMRAWRRLSSWTQAGELAAVAELHRRRVAQVAAGADPCLAEHAADELAAALTLTGRAADSLRDFAIALGRLPLTRAALASGDIDRARAGVISDEVTGLDGPHAAAVEAAVIGRAPEMTTGQLRAATRRAVLAADPAAADRRREAARKDARVEVWHEPAGTAALAGRDLAPADVLAADARISALARQIKDGGAEGTLDQLRARVYTALLTGRAQGLLPFPADGSPGPGPAGSCRSGRAGSPGSGRSGSPGPGRSGSSRAESAGSSGSGRSGSTGARPAGSPGPATPGGGPGGPGGPSGQSDRGTPFGGGGLNGTINLTMPLATWLGMADAPGEVPGFGPVPANDARELGRLLAQRSGTRWCVTLTGPDGRAVAHGCARAGPGPAGRASPTPPGRASPTPPGRASPTPPGRASPASSGTPSGGVGPGPPQLTVTITPLAVGTCDHRRESPGYHPSAGLRHVLRIRHQRCTAPGCRRPATQCDLDHTVPYRQGGRTCECGMAPLCRRHHRAKQAQGWRLDQPEPGVLVWRLPHGRAYTTVAEPYD